ncbi:hypothetical protein AB7M16_005095 [Bradyrhizobium sp. USDA 372]
MEAARARLGAGNAQRRCPYRARAADEASTDLPPTQRAVPITCRRSRWPAFALGLARLTGLAPKRLKFPRGTNKAISSKSTGGHLPAPVGCRAPRACHIKALGLQLSSWLRVTAVPRTEVVAAIQAFTDCVRRPSHTPAEDTYGPQRTEEQRPIGDPELKLSAQKWTPWRIALFRPYPNSRRSDARWGQIFPQRHPLYSTV